MRSHRLVIGLLALTACAGTEPSAVDISARGLAHDSYRGFNVVYPVTEPIYQNDVQEFGVCFCVGAEPFDPQTDYVAWYIGGNPTPIHVGLTVLLQPGEDFLLTAKHWNNYGQLIASSSSLIDIQGTSLDDACVPGGVPYCYTTIVGSTGAQLNELCNYSTNTTMPNESIVRWFVNGSLKQTGWLSSGGGEFSYAHPSTGEFDVFVTVEHAAIAGTKDTLRVEIGNQHTCSL